jgi:serine/threonine protein kinase
VERRLLAPPGTGGDARGLKPAGGSRIADFRRMFSESLVRHSSPWRLDVTSRIATIRMSTEGPQELPGIPELEGDYELIRELGRGGTAVVYLARERDVERYVAIKLMHPGYVQDEDAVARLMREARTVARLQHPNIVMLLGVRRLGERGYALILQYVPGTTVKERIRQDGPLPIPMAERILTDLGSALQYAHRHRIVHRDIKPENVFLDADTGVARLADFGIARIWDSDSGLTLPGTAIGTPTYMSPEQVDGRDLDGRSDLYSVGLVAWEMLTGQPPWAGETLYKIVYKQKHEELPLLEELRPEVPHYIRVAIEKALQKNPNDRWRDAGEFLAALQNPYAHLARPTARGNPPPGPSPLGPPTDAALEDAKTILFNRDEMEKAWKAGKEGPEGGQAEVARGRGASPPSPPRPPAQGAVEAQAPSWLLAVEQGAVGRADSGRKLQFAGSATGAGTGVTSDWTSGKSPMGSKGRQGGSSPRVRSQVNRLLLGLRHRPVRILVALLAASGTAAVLFLLLSWVGPSASTGESESEGSPGSPFAEAFPPAVEGEDVSGGLDLFPPSEEAGSPSSSTTTPSPPAVPVAIVDEAGEPRGGVAGTILPERVVVRVVDGNGDGVGGVDIRWEILSGGGELERTAGRTGPQGTVSNAWTLGASGGVQALRVRVVEPTLGTGSVAAILTAEAAPPPV